MNLSWKSPSHIIGRLGHMTVGCKGGWECEYMAFQSPKQETGSVNKEGGVGTGNWLGNI